MVVKRRFDIIFEESSAPITEPVTKFGGQPVWVGGNEWPISRAAGVPMRFVCQIVLNDLAIDSDYQEKMAYLFISDSNDAPDEPGPTPIIYGQSDPEAGENAVILQPGGDRIVETQEIVDGPSLFAFENRNRERRPVEFWVTLRESVDPDFVPQNTRRRSRKYYKTVAGNKLGGTVGFIQPDRFPFLESESELVLQLETRDIPFYVDFGDLGVGYLFVQLGKDRARFLWQSH